MRRLYDHVRGRRIRHSRGRLFFGWMARSPVLVCSRVTIGMYSTNVECLFNVVNLEADYIFVGE